ncbi:pyruvate, water dikinase regulatory protein [Paenibacillus sacheonensis]|uniref:Putative pyruvate, phosphate dikinase regulatory protein n=1 Tax=Paenibacillus sacheonensis TaxID=742054 RepID=A0A7X4YSI8_9BACL|nr:pyruvate, water dikinase regulatory protein [Paenibacillus sacheonensis]MBM7569221.1 regulator of PEP synthase PpsR (kinase-PPPase family) [Paenibacillus sacheonensis]NBC71767.1 kinase/pyrophosphorylase [Paenibacillus sacheonensis]
MRVESTGKRTQPIYICSDAVGETAEAVVKAAMRQFAYDGVKLVRCGHIKTEDEIVRIVDEAAGTGGFIAYTLVQPELRETMKEEALLRGVRAIDVLGPMMQAFIDTFNDSPKRQPGLLHALDDDYYRRIEAIEFAVKYDDGKDIRGLLLAEVVIVGVSRTSKTPLSIYLAHKGIRVANLPLVPEVGVPQELFGGSRLVIGLTMQPEKLSGIRAERLKAMGLPFSAQYASADRIQAELVYAETIMDRLGCPIIDVTEKAIEETAGIIIGWLQELQA